MLSEGKKKEPLQKPAAVVCFRTVGDQWHKNQLCVGASSLMPDQGGAITSAWRRAGFRFFFFFYIAAAPSSSHRQDALTFYSFYMVRFPPLPHCKFIESVTDISSNVLQPSQQLCMYERYGNEKEEVIIAHAGNGKMLTYCTYSAECRAE